MHYISKALRYFTLRYVALSILTGRTAFSLVHSSMPLPQSTPFLYYSYLPGRVGSMLGVTRYISTALRNIITVVVTK